MAQKFSNQQSTQSSQPQRSLNIFHLLICLGIGSLGTYFFAYLTQQFAFDSALAAYERGDCQQAINSFDRFIASRDQESDRVALAKAKRQECQIYQSTLDASEDSKQQLTLAGQFVSTYADSKLIAKLRSALDQNLNPQQAKRWVNLETCQNIIPLGQLRMIPQGEKTLPILYERCGNLLVATQKMTQSYAVFEQFLKQFPQHPTIHRIRRAYARSVVIAARRQGAGRLGTPGAAGYTADGSTMVTIRNDSPNAMRIVFSGPTPRVEELPPCKDCRRYSGVSRPKRCPNKGPLRQYRVNPGTYRMVVKSAQGSTVKPFIGNWRLKQGTAYQHCFYIVTQRRRFILPKSRREVLAPPHIWKKPPENLLLQ